MVTQQQSLMEDQDERLNHLSTSINRQNQLSMQIGDELDVHHQLLEDTVADEAKQYGTSTG